MKDAALLAVMPTLALPTPGYNTANVWPLTKSTDQPDVAVSIAYAAAKAENTIGGAIGMPLVDVVICGPLKNDLSNAHLQELTGQGDNNQVDFDDPRVATEEGTDGSENIGRTDGQKLVYTDFADYTRYMRTKLRIQVQYNYVMPIPFANWIMSNILIGQNLPVVMRMGKNDPTAMLNLLNYKSAQLYIAAQAGYYIAPINVSYAMRMQSDFYLNLYALPDSNHCVSYGNTNDTSGSSDNSSDPGSGG
jgi:hypothetical protein